MHVQVLTIFPRLIEGFLAAGLPRIAIEKGALAVQAIDLRDFTQDPHRKVDDRPFGGGAGMVMQCAPIFAAVEHLEHRESLESAEKPESSAQHASHAGTPAHKVMLTRSSRVSCRKA